MESIQVKWSFYGLISNVSDHRRNKNYEKVVQWIPRKNIQNQDFSNNEKYNIWSVIKYLNNQDSGLKSYWTETASFDFIKPLLRQDNVRDMINTLVDGGSIAITHVKINFSVDDFTILKELINLRSNEKIEPEGLDILFSYLFIAGYLTEDRNGRYKIPNQEIKYAFLTSLIAYYRKVYGLSNDIIDDITDNLQTLFEKDHLVINSEEKF